MNLVALPAFTDNYVWLLHDGHQGIVVDPGDAAVVVDALKALGLALRGILVTHHHGDHVGGLSALAPVLDGPVYAPATERIPGPVVPVRGGERIELLGLGFEVIDVPGHTAGHVAYLHRPAGEAPILFCGDTLFSGGCGRLFEGTPAQMHASLTTLAALPGETRVCCAHEYTLANLRFAVDVEPRNPALHDYVARCRSLREQGRPTLPGSIATERAINPFLRCAEPDVVQSALTHGAASPAPVDVFAALRSWKNDHR
ncbi:hydroxyacylglutathione hydrolase [Piscinibacter sakaiensis]|uniref:Hydroxyacylglutathione hydrolase n=1 Tax=Piscinibacter sakaiensis TaxID=1547922 RepID=A0A0K8NXH3_PISS1|nr:hydroxyacylglutathione hydrolase [Piscinibacter sakaiensis]GAP34625.1 hydroxyacylglutathione hydrolase [Piscinibacter sakaiensis]